MGGTLRAQDPSDLATKIEEYFGGELFRNLGTRRAEIEAYANERYSWTKVATAISVEKVKDAVMAQLDALAVSAGKGSKTVLLLLATQ